MSQLYNSCTACALYDHYVSACRALDPDAIKKKDLERPCAFFRTKEDYQRSCQQARLRQLRLFGTVMTGPVTRARS